MCGFKSLTTPYKYLSLIGPPDICIRIYQLYPISSENSPQEVSIDEIKIVKNVNPGGISNEPVLYYAVKNVYINPNSNNIFRVV